MKAVILTGGSPPEKPELARHLEGASLLIGVDGAADVLYRYGITPDVLVGDFDTADLTYVNALEKRGASVIRLAVEKNQTDTEAALLHALGCGADDIVMLGAIGTRFDHTLSNVQLLIKADKAGARCRIIDNVNEMFAACGDINVHGTPGQTMSILPLCEEICVNAEGVKYPLDALILKPEISRGISNIMERETVRIHISGGYALIVKTRTDA